jgi:hypothetical protein
MTPLQSILKSCLSLSLKIMPQYAYIGKVKPRFNNVSRLKEKKKKKSLASSIDPKEIEVLIKSLKFLNRAFLHWFDRSNCN